MNMHFVFLAVFALAGACAPPAETRVGDQAHDSDAIVSMAADDAEPIGDRIVSESELAGAFRIAGLDGEDLDAPFGASLTIASGMLTLEAQCARYSWRMSINEGVIALTPEARPSRLCIDGGEVHPKVAKLALAISQTHRAVRRPDNAVQLTGGGRSVTLFTQ